MTCDVCFDYGIQTVAIKENGKDIEICFRCIGGGEK